MNVPGPIEFLFIVAVLALVTWIAHEAVEWWKRRHPHKPKGGGDQWVSIKSEMDIDLARKTFIDNVNPEVVVLPDEAFSPLHFHDLLMDMTAPQMRQRDERGRFLPSGHITKDKQRSRERFAEFRKFREAYPCTFKEWLEIQKEQWYKDVKSGKTNRW